ncbi:hypothetical protein H8E88_00835 [candidate division KSB1 bacterium]|nr:hypothetical protein [candidate division KSB1 bacterium]MBL7146355.1 hypothetical protein [Phycisphaerae bacterium]
MLDKKSFFARYYFILFPLIGMLIMFSCQSNSGQNNFNGDFEVNPEQYGDPNGWFATRVPQTKEYVHFAWDSTENHSGSYSVSIAIDSTHPQDPIAYNWTRTFADFIIDKQYSISGWIKTMNLNETAWIVVQCWDENQKIIGFSTNQNSHPVQGTTDWTLVKTDFTVPDGTKEVRIRAGITSPKNNGGKVWFDDIKIE